VLHLVKTNADEDRLSDLHFQLSSADRRRIIEELQTQNLKLNEVAKKMGFTATEAFRQLQRLTLASWKRLLMANTAPPHIPNSS
jgi:predicted transcriptional regulator